MARVIPHERLRELPDGEQPLEAREVAARRARHGENDVAGEAKGSLRELAADTARDPMLWFLLATGALYAWLGETGEAAVLLASIVPLVAMDAALHRRTQVTTRTLGARLSEWALVVRDGQRGRIAARELVPGDLVLLTAGEFLPADGLAVGGDEIQVDESALTGEAVPVRKHALARLPVSVGDLAVPSEHWMAAGTRLLSGRAAVRVVFTGAETLYGQIARSARGGGQARTPLQRAVAELVSILTVLAAVVCVALAWVRWSQGAGVVDALISALTLAVAAIPEEFPVVFTFFLGVGVYRLARRKALVRRAVVVENIGRVTCIGTDKTGTLTEGRLSLAHRFPAPGESVEALLEIAALASRAGTGDPLDEAILREAPARRATTRVRASFPFTEDRRRETSALEQSDGQRGRAVVKGAPELVLGMCRLDREALDAWLTRTAELAATGHKVVACAARDLDLATWSGDEPTSGYDFAGLLACEDAVREGVHEAIEAARAAGIRVVMITGDHPATARAIARELGLGGDEPRVASADELFAEGAAGVDVVQIDVVARAMPSQKVALVRALQRAGHVVAVTGDGVNDVPALRAADVGIAMGERGTTSAREIASIVLMDDNFRTIVRAVGEGQQLFRNLQVSFAYLIAIHVPLVASAALIPLAGYPLLYLPVHVVWLELIIHPTALLAFQELPREVDLRALRRPGHARFFDAREWALLALVGAAATLAVIGGYLRALGTGVDVEHARAMALITLVSTSATVTVGLSRMRTVASRVVVALTVLSALLLVQTPSLAGALHVAPLHADDWALAALAGFVPGLLGIVLRRTTWSPSHAGNAAHVPAPAPGPGPRPRPRLKT